MPCAQVGRPINGCKLCVVFTLESIANSCQRRALPKTNIWIYCSKRCSQSVMFRHVIVVFFPLSSYSLISWLACVKDWQHQNLLLHPLPLSLACQLLHHHSIHQEQHLHRVSTWWGAQQTSWNPPMN